MVKHLGGTSYVNMEGGASLYDHHLFDRAGLELDFSRRMTLQLCLLGLKHMDVAQLLIR